MCKGTRQGGLSSPFLFNLLYQELVNELSNSADGIKITNISYNVFCYADDILIASLTVTGLQNMINLADKYISDHGLRFNPLKTECVSVGQNHYVSNPVWSLNGVALANSASIKYLGATLDNKPSVHVNDRIAAYRRAYYAMQGAGFCHVTTKANMLGYLWQSAIPPVFLNGSSLVYIKKGSMLKMEKLQAKLLKTSIGVHKFCKSSPISQARNISSLIRVYYR